MQSFLSEFGTDPGQPYLKSFYGPIPTDKRFAKVEYIQVSSTALDPGTTQVIFNLDPKEPPTCYLISDIILKAQTVITKENGTLPDEGFFHRDQSIHIEGEFPPPRHAKKVPPLPCQKTRTAVNKNFFIWLL